MKKKIITVSIYGSGQLGRGAARALQNQSGRNVLGPYSREQRQQALSSGADVVIIATTSRLRDVASDIEAAVRAGSNVLVSAEECAYPFAVDAALSERLNALATEKGVSIAGCGVNPGLIFDALVLTLLGAAPPGCTIEVRRTVDISGFGSAVLRRIGVGRRNDDFEAAVRRKEVSGHVGFVQSIWVVASAMGLRVDRIDQELLPVMASEAIDLPGRFVIRPGESAGVDQTYTAYCAGQRWYTCRFFGHVGPNRVGRPTGDKIELHRDGTVHQSISIEPGIGAQSGSQNMVANSVSRILRARPGWVTVADLEPAYPAAVGAASINDDTSPPTSVRSRRSRE